MHLAAAWRSPVLSSKYDITKHPNYKYLADSDKKNTFDIEKYLSTVLKPRPDEFYAVFDVGDVDSYEPETTAS